MITPAETAFTNLYRAYDHSGRLLYVGISFSALKRFHQHLRTSAWTDEVDTLKIEKFPDRSSALVAEKAAIVAERPVYNVIHNASTNCDRSERISAAIMRLDGARRKSPRGIGTFRPKYVFRNEIEAVFRVNCDDLLEDAAHGIFPIPTHQGRQPCWLREDLIQYLSSLGGTCP